jgi:hypothetical protein
MCNSVPRFMLITPGGHVARIPVVRLALIKGCHQVGKRCDARLILTLQRCIMLLLKAKLEIAADSPGVELVLLATGLRSICCQSPIAETALEHRATTTLGAETVYMNREAISTCPQHIRRSAINAQFHLPAWVEI